MSKSKKPTKGPKAPEQPIIHKMTSPYSIDLEMNKINKFDQQWYQVARPDRGVIDCRSVTTILKMAHPIDPGLIKYFKKNGEDSDKIRDDAGRLGSSVHKLIELTLTGKPVTFENEAGVRICTLDEWEIYLAWCRWYEAAKQEEGFKVLYVEQMVYDLDARIAGTVDLIYLISPGSIGCAIFRIVVTDRQSITPRSGVAT